MYLLTVEREERRERETFICCSTYLCIYWLILVRALTGDQTHTLGVSERCSNQLSYLTRVYITNFYRICGTTTTEERCSGKKVLELRSFGGSELITD